MKLRRLTVAAVATGLLVGGTIVGIQIAEGCKATSRLAPISIPFDGSRDVQAELDSWIESVPDGCGPGSATTSPYNTITLRPEGIYRIDLPLALEDRQWLSINGNGATLSGALAAPNQKQLILRRSEHLRLRSLTILGNNPRPGVFSIPNQWGHNLTILGSGWIDVDRVTGLNAYGDGVAIQPCGKGGNCSRDRDISPHDVTIRNSTFAGNGRQTVTLSGGDRISIQDNELGPSGYSLFDLEPEWAGLSTNDVRFVRNKLRRVSLHALALGGTCNQGMRNLVITDNEQIEPPRPTNLAVLAIITPTGCNLRGPILVARNRFIGLYGHHGFRFVGTRGLVVEDNVVTWAKIQFNPLWAVDLESSLEARIEGNTWNGPSVLVDPFASEWTAERNLCSGEPC